MRMKKLYFLIVISVCSLLCMIYSSKAQMSGFMSLNCGGGEDFTDNIGLEWKSDTNFSFGERASISVPNETRKQYMSVRYFPADARKYCYTLNVKRKTRYLIRTTFLYGNFDSTSNVYPTFDISLGATHWSTIVISDANTIEVRELIILANSPTISVCLSNATTGQPFVSTIELRQFNGAIYYTHGQENEFFLAVSARINFGALTQDPIRFPDDPFDRLWESDSLQKPNYLINVAPGTKKVSTNTPINVDRDERPPEKVMQTAVVGTTGSLTYRLNLDGFPGFAWAVFYLAEIEDLSAKDTRKFSLVVPGMPGISKTTVDIQENAKGKFQLYEKEFTNISLPFAFNFKFGKASGSTRGPLLNAMEINKYLKINPGSIDATVMASFISQYLSADWAKEGGDPCLPVPWSWVRCNSDPQPKIISITLSKKNLTGNIPLELTKLQGLVELWLDGNSLTGRIPDFSACKELRIIHLENNLLTGEIPSSLTTLPKLEELYLQGNMLSGTIPSGLLLNQNLVFNYTGNHDLNKEGSNWHGLSIVIGVSVGVALLLLAVVVISLLRMKSKGKSTPRENMGLDQGMPHSQHVHQDEPRSPTRSRGSASRGAPPIVSNAESSNDEVDVPRQGQDQGVPRTREQSKRARAGKTRDRGRGKVKALEQERPVHLYQDEPRISKRNRGSSSRDTPPSSRDTMYIANEVESFTDEEDVPGQGRGVRGTREQSKELEQKRLM
ncbi:hypothetical protein MKW92_017969 [Papaver armeniacum]|nr:hypothetical protein MKW92_017969 [Papaver armeniacum]